MAFRYGGEEFLLLLPGIGPDQASMRAEEIRAAMGELRVEHLGDPLGPVTVSIGVASVPEHCSARSLVRTADAALLRAKSSGRNRVESAVARKNAA
jgi:diguanylate cyclase (GGDEF)-like protein